MPTPKPAKVKASKPKPPKSFSKLSDLLPNLPNEVVEDLLGPKAADTVSAVEKVSEVLDYPDPTSIRQQRKLVPIVEHFPKIREAREALKSEALDILRRYRENAEIAQQHGDYIIAKETYEFLLEHMPLDSDGEALLGPSIDKTKPEVKSGNVGPQINIGFQLGGVATPKALPAGPSIIDVTGDKSE